MLPKLKSNSILQRMEVLVELLINFKSKTYQSGYLSSFSTAVSPGKDEERTLQTVSFIMLYLRGQ